VDINPFTVAFCRSKGLDARLGEEGRYPFDDAVFDSVILDNVLEHLEDPQPTLVEVLRVLRPGGRILIGVPGRKGYALDPSHRHFYDVQALTTLLFDHGCVTRKIFGMPFRSGWLDKNMSQYCVYGVFDALPAGEGSEKASRLFYGELPN